MTIALDTAESPMLSDRPYLTEPMTTASPGSGAITWEIVNDRTQLPELTSYFSLDDKDLGLSAAERAVIRFARLPTGHVAVLAVATEVASSVVLGAITRARRIGRSPRRFLLVDEEVFEVAFERAATSAHSWRRATKALDLPRLAGWLSVSDKRIPLNAEDQKVLRFAQLTSGEHVIISTFTDAEHPVVGECLIRARHAGLNVRDWVVCEPSLFAACVENASLAVAIRDNEDNQAERLLIDLLRRGIAIRATDLHFWAGHTTCEVVARVDGDIRRDPIAHLGLSQHAMLARMIFRASGANLQSREWTPDNYLDCSIDRDVDGLPYQLRFSQRPNLNGFDYSLRVLRHGHGAVITDFEQLGLLPWHAAALKHALSRPEGSVFLVGQMNSGKTTTIAASLAHIVMQHPNRLIQTLEHPIEYQIPGVRQSPLSERASGTDDAEAMYEAALRALVRSDANVLMLGEIRDRAGAVHAQSLRETGHMVLATIHAATQTLALQRLIGYGAKSEVLFSSKFVTLLVQQKLLPTLCPHCSIPLSDAIKRNAVDRHMLDALTLCASRWNRSIDGVRLRNRHSHCAHCGNCGTSGRTVAVSLLAPSKGFNAHMARGDYDAAHESWLSGAEAGVADAPFAAMLGHALDKVLAGKVCPSDVADHVEPITPESLREFHLLRGHAC